MNGQYDLIIRMMDKRFDKLEVKVDEKFDCMSKDVRRLENFKWRVIGFSAGVVAVFSAVGFLINLLNTVKG